MAATVVALAGAGAWFQRDAAVKAQEEAVAQRNIATKAQREAETQRNSALAAKKLADQQRSLAESAKSLAESTLAAATGTAKGLVDGIVEREKDAQGAQVSVLQDILARANALLTKLAKANGTTPAIQATQASALASIAVREAGPLQAQDLATAIARAQALVRQQPGSAADEAVLGKAADARGETLYFKHDYAPALVAQRLGRDAYKQCYALDATNGDCLYNEANSEAWIANILSSQHNYAAALPRYDAALALFNTFLTKWPAQKPWVDKMTAGVIMNKAEMFENIGHLNQALAAFHQALPIMIARARAPNALQSDMRALANIYNSMANTLAIQMAHDRRLSGATRAQKARLVLDYLAAAWVLSERLAKADPGNGMEVGNLAAVQKNLQTACLNFGYSRDPTICLHRAGISIAPGK